MIVPGGDSLWILNCFLHTQKLVFLILALPSDENTPRLGITVTRKVDKRAVARNRLKRRIRQVFRLLGDRFKAPVDLVVIARREACACSYAEVEKELVGTLHYHGFLNRSKGKISDR